MSIKNEGLEGPYFKNKYPSICQQLKHGDAAYIVQPDYEPDDGNRLRHNPNFKKAARILGGIALIGSLYWSDVGIGWAEQIQTQPYVYEIAPPAKGAPNDTATIIFPGFGRSTGLDAAPALDPLEEQGWLFTLKYDKAGIEMSTIDAAIEQAMDEYGVDHLILYGISTGGIVALKSAAPLVEDTDLHIDEIHLDSVPSSLATVRAASRNESYELTSLLNEIPGSKYSYFLRSIGEMVMRSDRYDNEGVFGLPSLGNFIKTAIQVRSDLHNTNLTASTTLMEAQVNMLVNSDVKGSLELLAKYSDVLPIISYELPVNENDDYMVDDVGSLTEFEKEAIKLGYHPIIKIHVAGKVHSVFYNVKEYNDALTQSRPMINAARDEVWQQYIANVQMKFPGFKFMSTH